MSAAHCNTLQHTATHHDTLQHAATRRNTLQHTATHCNTLQDTAIHYNTPQYTATHCSTLQHTATHCNALQHTATHCNTLQRTATHTTIPCNTLCTSHVCNEYTIMHVYGKGTNGESYQQMYTYKQAHVCMYIFIQMFMNIYAYLQGDRRHGKIVC